MNETTEQLLIWGSAGIGLGLLTSGHRHLGILVSSVAPATAAIAHPKGTHRVLRSIPVAMAVSGRALGTSGRVSGVALWKTAKEARKGFKVARKTIVRSVS